MDENNVQTKPRVHPGFLTRFQIIKDQATGPAGQKPEPLTGQKIDKQLLKDGDYNDAGTFPPGGSCQPNL